MIAIVGAGIGGLAAAGFLCRAGLPVTVYEQARELREVGAGLVVAPNAVRSAVPEEAIRLGRRCAGIDENGLRFDDGQVVEADVVIGADGVHSVSHARSHLNHLPDGPEQLARDVGLGNGDPLAANGWIYGYDPLTPPAAPRAAR